MENIESKKDEILRVVKQKMSKVPVGFVIGAVVGGGLFLYANKNRARTGGKAIVNIAKLAAPYVILAVLDKFVDEYDKRKTHTVEDVNAEVS